ncbi:MAG: cobyric acid synthase [Dehalococcoidia bacterium]|nr:cobyric acid synthase [Dehalococcoidia bacterium]
MVQGTASSAGKSVLVAAFCRIFRQDGYRVAPFKSQNMSLNSFVTREGGEMGRAQVVQAEAAGVEPHVDMNPILLKPEMDQRSQVVLLGKPVVTTPAAEYYRHTPALWEEARKALARLMRTYEVVVIEGAGSPAEINLRDREIVNMRVAREVNAPVLLVGDIDRGGVFASLVGTLALLTEAEQDAIKGFIINKFRGDVSLLQPGLDMLEERTGKPVLGVVPYWHDIEIAQEDSIFVPAPRPERVDLDIAVLYLPRISNSTDFEPFQQEEGVQVRYIRRPQELGTPDLVIVPGTKSTIADLAHLRETGLAGAVLGLAQQGVPVMGICGGFQMLGRLILDPHHVESKREEVQGLGLLPVETVFAQGKTTQRVTGRVGWARGLLDGTMGLEVTGYEIHMGQTSGDGLPQPFLVGNGSAKPHLDGAASPEGLVIGTYLHGLFQEQGFRTALLNSLRRRKGLSARGPSVLPSREDHYNRLADLVRSNLDMEKIYRMCGLS